MEFTAFTCHFCAERQEWDTPVTKVPDLAGRPFGGATQRLA